MLIAAGSLQALASLGLVLGNGFFVMIGFLLLLQAGQAVTGPAWQALVPRIVGDELVGKAIGLQQSLSAIAGLGGAAVGGVLYQVLGFHLTLLVDTATFALLVLVAMLVQTRRGRRFDMQAGPHASGAEGEIARRGGWAVIRSDALLRFLVPALWLFILAAEAPNVVEIFLIRRELGASAAVYGFVMAGFMAGQIAGPLLAGPVGDDRARVTWAAASAAAIGGLMVAIGLSVTVWMVAPLFVVLGVAAGAINALIGALVVTRPADHERGRVIATLSGIARGMSVLALTLGGLCGQLVGARETLVICGSLSVVVALVVGRARSSAGIEEVAEPGFPATMAV